MIDEKEITRLRAVLDRWYGGRRGAADIAAGLSKALDEIERLRAQFDEVRRVYNAPKSTVADMHRALRGGT